MDPGRTGTEIFPFPITIEFSIDNGDISLYAPDGLENIGPETSASSDTTKTNQIVDLSKDITFTLEAKLGDSEIECENEDGLGEGWDFTPGTASLSVSFGYNFGLIDSQDSIVGNPLYDVASLIDDVRLKTSTRLKQDIFEEYIKNNKKINIENFKNDFEILSVLRNLKIIGIFTRLSMRDNKKTYLKLIPYAWKLIEQRTEKNAKFIELRPIHTPIIVRVFGNNALDFFSGTI